jgi:hypothetical protein
MEYSEKINFDRQIIDMDIWCAHYSNENEMLEPNFLLRKMVIKGMIETIVGEEKCP